MASCRLVKGSALWLLIGLGGLVAMTACQSDKTAGDPDAGLLVPLGMPCAQHSQCVSGNCVQMVGGAMICTESCDSASDCVVGWSCEPYTGLTEDVCQCTTSAENCDGLDNDCDREIDEGSASELGCPAGGVCQAGSCECPVDQCGDQCVDTASDPAHCGGCGEACLPNEGCDAGFCVGCNEVTRVALSGDHQVLIDFLRILSPATGMDLDGDGQVDNVLGPLGALFNGSFVDAFDSGDLVIPLELWDLDDLQADDCVAFGFHASRFPPDHDDDGAAAGGFNATGGDCSDHDPGSGPFAAEVPGDAVDNNCDGLADELSPGTPSTDSNDFDGDGYTLADGDCDDRAPGAWPGAPAFWDPTLIHPGQAEICGDGFDNNCDGVADEGCNPYVGTGDLSRLEVDMQLLDAVTQEPQGLCRSGRVENGQLSGGPSQFFFALSLDGADVARFELTQVFIQADLNLDPAGLWVTNAMLGGVLSGQSLDRAPNFAADLLGGDESSTMLDVLVGSVGILLGLPTVGVCVPRQDGVALILPLIYCNANADCGNTTDYRCNADVRAPDIDVDADGMEVFLDLNLDGDPTIEAVDTCIDGDGTMVQDTLDATGVVIQHCTAALGPGGEPRFVDGFSIALEWSGVPTVLHSLYDSQP